MTRLPLIAVIICVPKLAGATETDDIRAELSALSARIERLQDVSDVEKLPRYYSYYVDKMQWRSVADLFAEDGTLEIGGRGVFLGREGAYRYLHVGFGPGPRDGIIMDHQNLQPLVTIHDDGKTAEARAIAFVMGGAGWGHVYYENDYVKEDGVWKMSKLHGPFNMYCSYKIGWVDETTINNRPLPRVLPDMPSTVNYLTYPNYYVEPYHYPNPVTGKPMPPHDPAAGGLAYERG